jgi:hypothetical protein
MSEPETNAPPPGQSKKTRSRWPQFAVTALLGAAVIFILTPQQFRFLQAVERHRTEILAKPQTRDFLTGPALFREIDRQLPPDAKIFFCGVIGTNKSLYPYFFARTFLFPHEMEISIDHKADYQVDGFRGVDCFNPDQLRTNGYDLMMTFKAIDGSILTFPLTQKGTLKK